MASDPHLPEWLGPELDRLTNTVSNADLASGIDRVLNRMARESATSRDVDPVEALTAPKTSTLASAYRGAMAPFRQAIMDAANPQDAITRVQRLYADWQPERVARMVEEAMQLAAAGGVVNTEAD